MRERSEALTKVIARWVVGTLSAIVIAPLHGQITTQNAGVVSPEIPTLRESIVFEESKDYQSTRLEHKFLYGVTPSLELGISVPTVVSQRVGFVGVSGIGSTARLSGLGDVSLALKRSLYQVDDVLESTRWAVVGRLKAPTGDDDAKDNGVRLPRKLQLGNGSWGFGGAGVFTVIRDRHRFSAEASYFHQTRHEGFRPGPEADLNLAYWYRLHPAKFQPGLGDVEIRPVVELLTHHQFSSRASSGRVRDNGWVISLAPGVQVYPRTNLLFEFNVSVPVFQDVDDPLGDRRWAAEFAIKFLF